MERSALDERAVDERPSTALMTPVSTHSSDTLRRPAVRI
jgi:hypothetical protein